MRLSLQLFTLRDAMASDPNRTLAALAEMGLQHVELAGLYGRSAVEFRETLDANGLLVSGCHVGLEDLERDLERVADESLELGNTWVIVPWVAPERRQWGELAQALSGLAERLAVHDLMLAYHNHDFEFGPDQGLRQLIADAHPLLVHFQVDVGWVRMAGEDPAKFLWELGPRAPLVHLKDMDPRCDNPHVVAGDGAVKWDEVLAACQGVGVQFGAIEMDLPPGDPVEAVRSCVDYFRARGLT